MWPRVSQVIIGVGRLGTTYFFVRLYGDWLVGFKEIPSFWASARTAPSVRPNVSRDP